MNDAEYIQYMYYINNKIFHIFKYLSLLNEEVTLVNMFNGIMIVFDNGIKSALLKEKIYPYLVDGDRTLFLFPLEEDIIEDVAEIIFKF